MYVFFLGGYDLEMLRIKDILSLHKHELFDKCLDWGAKASAYEQEIAKAAEHGKVPVLIELELDIPVPPSAIVIDHHGDRSTEPASLVQVMRLIDLVPLPWDMFIAANDVGYIPAMKALGASDVEVQAIRTADRRAQGVTKEMEQQAVEALAHTTTINGTVVVRIPHEKWSAVADRLYPIWPDGKENLVVISEVQDEVPRLTYLGRGDICKALKEKFAGWGGGKGFGDPDANAFAGCRTEDTDAVVHFIVHYL